VILSLKKKKRGRVDWNGEEKNTSGRKSSSKKGKKVFSRKKEKVLGKLKRGKGQKVHPADRPFPGSVKTEEKRNEPYESTPSTGGT